MVNHTQTIIFAVDSPFILLLCMKVVYRNDHEILKMYLYTDYDICMRNDLNHTNFHSVNTLQRWLQRWSMEIFNGIQPATVPEKTWIIYKILSMSAVSENSG